jgi:hypothetical protein
VNPTKYSVDPEDMERSAFDEILPDTLDDKDKEESEVDVNIV